MRVPQAAVLALLVASASATQVYNDDEVPSSTTHVPACTATSSSGSGAFFDLRPDMAVAAEDGKTHRGLIVKDYHAKGHDYGKNFTLNICGAVVEPILDVIGVNQTLWANVSAYYESHGKFYSIGSESQDLLSRGRKLVLQYTGGSPCGPDAESATKKSKRDDANAYFYDDEDDALVPGLRKSESSAAVNATRRKSTTISFLCDRDPGSTQATVSFVGTDPDECAYFFEARSLHACAHAEPHKPGSVGPGSVFGLILVIAVLVYILGGVFYNRTVAHARGWRQLPNYQLWAGIWSFISDMFFILVAKCLRLVPSRRGYSHLSSSPSSRHRNSEAENRLIDQLDEEWDD
ncbi:putative vacuolar sorting receptor [Stachybotrys elegans]|uniref:Vacuolar sorting receptor n=1 Tax=Stachybotrys elegans TaxID=80388 RepID=A0A8K0T2U9_9HYPO|nr:putative vacuolar sorting receptor [Stachybotrys elegans]